MGLFSRNPNESAYIGGKKHWVDILKNTGGTDCLIWRQPEEDFNTNSTLVVMPGENAIFVYRGEVVAVFSEGSYKLTTENYPFISRIRNAFSGGISEFNCVVYYVATTVSQEFLWGTPDRIDLRDKKYGLITSVGANGTYQIRVTNPEKLLYNVVGNGQRATRKDFEKFARGQMLQIIISELENRLDAIQDELINIQKYQSEYASEILPKLNEVLVKRDYGVEVTSFSIVSLKVDKTVYEKIDEAHLGVITEKFNATGEAEKEVIAAQGHKAAVDTMGYDLYRGDQAMGVLTEMANNPNAGGIASTAMGLGAGVGVMGGTVQVVNELVQQAFKPITNPSTQTTPQEFGTPSSRFTQTGNPGGTAGVDPAAGAFWSCECGKTDNTDKFCSNCGRKRPEPEVSATWDCVCGKKGNTDNFCSSCGRPRSN